MDSFYRDFEDKFRGSREDIKSRLNVYSQFLIPLLKEYPKGGAIDLGCGRGEWLDLTQNLGFSSTGVDLDEGMLAACVERGLNAVKGSALEFLEKLDDQSQVVVSAFHVAEHISITELRQWVSEALRVLKPGGLLIVETPNPENLLVSSVNFYLDPTHLRPIPPALLGFIFENAGFETVKTLRLQEPKDFGEIENLQLRDVFYSVSPDYSVIGQKAVAKGADPRSSFAFNSNFGVTLDSVLNLWEAQFVKTQSEANQATAVADEADKKANQATAVADEADKKANQATAVADEADKKANQATTVADEALKTANEMAVSLEKVYLSRSWRYTAALRWLGSQLRRWRTAFLSLISKKGNL